MFTYWATELAQALATRGECVEPGSIVLSGGLSEDALELQVENEASQYIPFALEEVSLDFDVIGPLQNSLEDVEVLLAASRKEKVEDRVAVAIRDGMSACEALRIFGTARSDLDDEGFRAAAAGALEVVADQRRALHRADGRGADAPAAGGPRSWSAVPCGALDALRLRLRCCGPSSSP